MAHKEDKKMESRIRNSKSKADIKKLMKEKRKNDKLRRLQSA